MERKSFIRSLITLAVAPKLIAELNIPAVAAPLPAGPTTLLFSQLHFVVPDYMPALIAKYGNDDFLTIMNEIGNGPLYRPQVYAFENEEIIVRDATPEEIGKPVTITLNQHPNQ